MAHKPRTVSHSRIHHYKHVCCSMTDYAWPSYPDSKRTQLLCVTCTICELPVVVCHGPQLPCMRYSLWGFSCRRCALTVALHRLSIRGCFVFVKYLNALGHKQTNKQASIHTHVHNAVMLVWGSLRLMESGAVNIQAC